MNGFDRQGYVPTREPEPEPWYSFDAGLARPIIAVAVLGLVAYGGYMFLKSISPADEPAASGAQLAQMGERLDTLEQRLDQMEKKRRGSKEISEPATPSPAIAAAITPDPPKHHLAFSRPVSSLSASSSPAPSPAKSLPPSDPPPKNALNSEPVDPAQSQQQWEATADRLGNVVGELDSQRNMLDSQREAIERDQKRLDELAGRFARNSQPFTLGKGSDQQQVGPVWLRLQGTDPKNQRYTMRVSVDDKMIELKDRALHEAIQFYASGGKLTFELVVSQIQRDGVKGRLVLPQTTATR